MKRLCSLVVSLLVLCWAVLPALNLTASATTVNLMANPSAETANGASPANWTADSWGTSNTTLSYASTGNTGVRSLLITTSGRSSGDSKWIPDAVNVTANQSYTYADYYQTDVTTELDAQYTNAGGAVSYAYLATVPASATWAPITTTFTIPSTATKVSVMHILAANGSLQTDDFSLTTTTPVTPPGNTDGNLVSNPSFETANGNIPANWQNGGWGTNTSIFTYVNNDGHTGIRSAKVQTTAYTSGDAKWYFAPIAVQASTAYTLSDYYKSTISSSLVAQYTDAAGVVTYQTLSVPTSSSTWQMATVNFTTPATAKTMVIFHLITGVGTLQIDDVSVIPTTVTPPTSPSISLTSPAANTVVSGTVSVNATASSAAGVNNVQFKLDGINLGSPVTASPYQTSWNTISTPNGTHSLTAIVTANDSQSAVSTTVNVTVNNQSATGNQISNPSLEIVDPANAKQPLNWNSSTWGTNKTTFSYLATGHSGTHSVKTQISSYSSGSSYWGFAARPVTPGQLYDFTDYYKSNVVNEIDATFTMSDGSVQYQYLGDPSPSPNSWTKFETQFTAPTGAVSVTMAHNIYSVGWLTTDDYSLTTFSYQGFNRPIISITSDDAYASYYKYGLPLEQKYGLTATDYILTGYINNTTGYMTSAMVKALYAAGHEIGSHSVSHLDLTTVTATKMDAELKNSQTFLQTLLGVPIKDYAAPYGAYNQQVVNNSKLYYQTYRGVQSGYNAKNNFDANNIMVQNLVVTTTLAEVKSWIAQAQATNTWLVLVYHQIDPSAAAGEYNTYPSDFDAQLAAIKASGVAVETVAQAVAEIQPQL